MDVSKHIGDLEAHRPTLMHHCRRILGSATEAEDAVQETIIRAWRRFDQLEQRTSLRPWLKRIASNVCLDMINAPQRRSAPSDFATAEPRDSDQFVGDVSDTVESNDRVRQAVIAVLQRLPARQRAVIILHDVLCWRSKEIAELFSTTAAAVNSILQRARETLARDRGPSSGGRTDCADPERLMKAFEHHDVTSLVVLLGRDAGLDPAAAP